MRSQITSRIKRSSSYGFLSFEIMLSLSLFALFTVSIFSFDISLQKIKIWSLKELEYMKDSSKSINQIIKDSNIILPNIFKLSYGNDSLIYYDKILSITKSDYVNSWGGSSCSSRIDFNKSKVKYFNSGVFLGSGNISTDIEARNSIVYLTADSSTQSQSDLFIINAHDIQNPIILSSLNTGPGISAIAVAGPYLYLANTSSLSQLQIIDIHNINFPYIVSQLRLPLPEASTTPAKGSAIYYKNGYIYLGTSKWDGPEFYVIDVVNPFNPQIIGSFETNTLINDIFVYKDNAYIATSDEYQMRILDITDKNSLLLEYGFAPSGWQTQQGKVINYFENILSLGRTVGGINRIMNHESFIFSTTTEYSVQFSSDIPGGVYGILLRQPFIFLITHAIGEEFQVWNMDFTKKIYSKSLGINPIAMSCDWSNIFMATGNEMGFSLLKLN